MKSIRHLTSEVHLPEKKRKKVSEPKSSIPFRLSEEKHNRVMGFLNLNGQKFQTVVEQFLDWYCTTGRQPWLEVENGNQLEVSGQIPTVMAALNRIDARTEELLNIIRGETIPDNDSDLDEEEAAARSANQDPGENPPAVRKRTENPGRPPKRRGGS